MRKIRSSTAVVPLKMASSAARSEGEAGLAERCEGRSDARRSRFTEGFETADLEPRARFRVRSGRWLTFGLADLLIRSVQDTAEMKDHEYLQQATGDKRRPDQQYLLDEGEGSRPMHSSICV